MELLEIGHPAPGLDQDLGSLLGVTCVDQLQLAHQLVELVARRRAGIHRPDPRAHVAERPAPGPVRHDGDSAHIVMSVAASIASWWARSQSGWRSRR